MQPEDLRSRRRGRRGLRRPPDERRRPRGGGLGGHDARRAVGLHVRPAGHQDRPGPTSPRWTAWPSRRPPPRRPPPTRPVARPPRSGEYDLFNNDARLRAIRTLAEALAPIEQKKAILYFSNGMSRSGSDNQVELRTTISAAVRANVSLYPVDARGLQAVVPGGDATRASATGVNAVLGPRRARTVRSARRLAGNPADAGVRHGRPRLHRQQRAGRRVRAGATRHVGLLPVWLQHLERRRRTESFAASRCG